jgi:tetratricopeptide (TPR) repeat protein
VLNPAGFDWVIKAYNFALEMGDESYINTGDLFRHWLLLYPMEDYRKATVEHLEDLLVYFEKEFSNSIGIHMNLFLLGILHTYQGNFDRAIHYCKRSLNLAKYWQDLFWISASLNGLAETYVQMGLIDEARSQLLDLLEWHLAIGQTWQTLSLLYGKALETPEFIGGDETATNIISMVFHHDEGPANFQQYIEMLLPEIKERMGQEAFAAAWEKGKGMDFETVVSLFRSALTSAESN